jgi:beta-lactamase class A
MLFSRRALLAVAPATLRLSQAHPSYDGYADQRYRNRDYSILEAEIQKAFADLPARKSFKIWAPPSRRAPEFTAELNASQQQFSASANKSFILCARLRQLDAPDVEEKLVSHELRLDESVWSIGSTIFNPPQLSGLVSERTAMEAMVTQSDNTATDMVLKEATVKSVRSFVAAIGAQSTLIPDSTRALAGYLFGASNYKTITWDELLAVIGPLVNPALNDFETFAASANDLVSFYARALQGRFFQHEQTLQEFRRILSLGDINHLVPFPLGMSVFGKAGYFDSSGQHARSIAGGIYFLDRWVYLATILNWDAKEQDDPETVKAYFRATRTAVELVRDALGN